MDIETFKKAMFEVLSNYYDNRLNTSRIRGARIACECGYLFESKTLMSCIDAFQGHIKDGLCNICKNE